MGQQPQHCCENESEWDRRHRNFERTRTSGDIATAPLRNAGRTLAQAHYFFDDQKERQRSRSNFVKTRTSTRFPQQPSEIQIERERRHSNFYNTRTTGISVTATLEKLVGGELQYFARGPRQEKRVDVTPQNSKRSSHMRHFESEQFSATPDKLATGAGREIF